MPLNTFANRTSSLPLSELDANFTFVSDSTNLSFLQSGTGAVSRTVQAKERDIVSVLDFGANTTPGTTDMASVINAAITAVSTAGGGVLIFPPGNYLHNTAITLKNNVTIFGYGATLTWGGGAASQIATSSSATLDNAGMLGFKIVAGASATTVLELRSLYKCVFRDLEITSDNTSNLVIDLTVNTSGGTNPVATRNAVLNVFDNIYSRGNCGTFLRLKGDSTTPTVVTLNTFSGINAENCNVLGIEFHSWCDNNAFSGVCRVRTVANNAVGVVWNTGTPASNVGVYANNFQLLAVDTFGTLTGRIGIRMNYTYANRVDYFYQDPQAEGGAYSINATDTKSYYIGHQVSGTTDVVVRQKNFYIGGADNPSISVGGAVSTESTGIWAGLNRAGSGFSSLNLVGDTTYTTYGFRILRGNSGANTTTNLLHRGTGSLQIKSEDAGGGISLLTSAATRITMNDTGIGFFGASAAAKPTITGSRGGNAALADLLTELATLGLITDSSSA